MSRCQTTCSPTGACIQSRQPSCHYRSCFCQSRWSGRCCRCLDNWASRIPRPSMPETWNLLADEGRVWARYTSSFVVVDRLPHGSWTCAAVDVHRCAKTSSFFRREDRRSPWVHCWRCIAELSRRTITLRIFGFPRPHQWWRHRCHPQTAG